MRFVFNGHIRGPSLLNFVTSRLDDVTRNDPSSIIPKINWNYIYDKNPNKFEGRYVSKVWGWSKRLAYGTRSNFYTLGKFLTGFGLWVWLILLAISKPFLTTRIGIMLYGYEGGCSKHTTRLGQRTSPPLPARQRNTLTGGISARGTHTFRGYPHVPILMIWSCLGSGTPPASVFLCRAGRGEFLCTWHQYIYSLPRSCIWGFAPYAYFAARGVKVASVSFSVKPSLLCTLILFC